MNTSKEIERNDRLIRQYFNEIWNKENLDLLDEIISPEYLNHSSSIRDPKPGPEGLKPIVRAMRQAFPDLHYEIRDLVITPNRIVARVWMTGSHLGDFFGIPPTNRQVAVSQINIEYIKDGKITEHWRLTDELSLLKQLGIIAA